MDKQKIIELDLDELHISTDNPRTSPVMDEGVAIYDLINEQGEKIINLAKNIISQGWIVNDLPSVFLENNKYVVYEGNRRITCLKCFFNPKLLPSKNKISKKFENYINSFSEEEKKEIRKNFNKIPVALYTDKEELYRYMELRHTPNNGKGDTIEKWSTAANERFKNEIRGKKSLIYLVFEKYKNEFKNKDSFPMTTLSRLLNNGSVKKKLKYTFKDKELKIEDEKVFLYYLRRFIDDIESRKENSRSLLNASAIENYIQSIEGTKINNNINKDDDKTCFEENENVKKIEKKDVPERNTKAKVIIVDYRLFSHLNLQKLDRDNKENKGIIGIYNELIKLSKEKQYEDYPIATAMLIRSFLEQSLKYQLKKIGKWDEIVAKEKTRTNGINKEPGLDYLIDYCHGNSNQVFQNDSKIQRCFNSFAFNDGTKAFLDMVVHHPECVSVNDQILENIINNGLYEVIEYIFNT